MQVAQLVPHKDPVTFVEAVATARVHVPDIQALIVGDGPLRDAARAAIDRLGLAASTHRTGYRTDADALLAAADVVALSSREEGLGTVLLDALALGKPIAATTAGGIPEIVTGECGRLTPVGDAPALGNAIGALMLEVRTDRSAEPPTPRRLARVRTRSASRARRSGRRRYTNECCRGGT